VRQANVEAICAECQSRKIVNALASCTKALLATVCSTLQTSGTMAKNSNPQELLLHWTLLQIWLFMPTAPTAREQVRCSSACHVFHMPWIQRLPLSRMHPSCRRCTRCSSQRPHAAHSLLPFGGGGSGRGYGSGGGGDGGGGDGGSGSGRSRGAEGACAAALAGTRGGMGGEDIVLLDVTGG
jgi:hypothetical protein